MRIQANDGGLDERRPFAAAQSADDRRDDLVDSIERRAIDDHAWNAEAVRDAVDLRRGLFALGNADCVAVVLDGEEDR